MSAPQAPGKCPKCGLPLFGLRGTVTYTQPITLYVCAEDGRPELYVRKPKSEFFSFDCPRCNGWVTSDLDKAITILSGKEAKASEIEVKDVLINKRVGALNSLGTNRL